MIQIARLADDFTFQSHECVGSKNHRFRMKTRDGGGFALRIEQSQFAKGKIDIELFGDVGRNSFKIKASGGKQFAPPR